MAAIDNHIDQWALSMCKSRTFGMKRHSEAAAWHHGLGHYVLRGVSCGRRDTCVSGRRCPPPAPARAAPGGRRASRESAEWSGTGRSARGPRTGQTGRGSSCARSLRHNISSHCTLWLELGKMVSISKYRGSARYRYQTFKVSKYRLTTGWFICNVIPWYRG